MDNVSYLYKLCTYFRKCSSRECGGNQKAVTNAGNFDITCII